VAAETIFSSYYNFID